MHAIPDMELDNARMVLSAQYTVQYQDLKFVDEWRAPEIGKILLMFLIADPDHLQFGSTVTYTVGQGGTTSAAASRNLVHA